MPNKDVLFSKKHPKEMYLLTFIEICQRFAYWGIANLLVLFLVNYFSYPTAKATSIFAFYTGAAFTLPLLGGFIADKWNYRSPILLGILLTALGCFALSTLNPAFIIPALALIGLGGGLFTPTIYSLLGGLYTDKQHIREGGFSIYYSLVNIGVFISMIVLGYLQTINWRYVFITAGVVQLLGIFPYIKVVRNLKSLKVPPHYFISKKNDPNRYKLKRHEWDRIIVILIMTLVSTLFWMAYNQVGSSMTLFAQKYTNRTIGNFVIPVPWLTAMQTFFLIVFAFPLARFYLFLKGIRSSASPPMKTALSLFLMGLCFLVMQRAAHLIPIGAISANIPAYYQVGALALMALAELFLAPIGLSLTTNLSPHRYRGLLTGVWFTCIGVGFYLGGFLAKFIETLPLTSFFDIFIFTSFIPALLLVFFSRKLDKMRHIGSL